MSDLEGVHVADPLRATCIASVFTPSPLEEVAAAVAEATMEANEIYVERLGQLWRWSLLHRGGAYPLLRISARFLKMDYQSIYIGFRTVGDGLCILTRDPESPTEPDRWAVLEFDGPCAADEVARRMAAAS